MIGKGLQTGAGVQPWHKRALAGLLLALMLTVGLFAMVSPASAQEGDEEMQGAMSFYALSSSLSSFLGSSLSPDFDGERDAMWNQVTDNGGSGGSMLGYADSNRNDGAGWLTSSWTAGSHTMSYSSLTVDTGDSEENRLTGPTAYTYMGAALNGLGLDKTQSGMSLGFTSLIGGGILYLLYAASTGINTVFWGVIWLLQKLNPFQLFYPAVAAINPEFAEGMVGGDTQGLPPFLAGLASAIAQWYGALNTVAWAAMVPVFLGVLLIGFFLFKKMDKGSAVKKFVVRLLYIGLGLPLIGSMYTGTLNAVESEISGSNPNATQVITETLVDFENWAMRSNLYIPAGADISWSPPARGRVPPRCRTCVIRLGRSTSVRPRAWISRGGRTS